jgi:hypothetical protein
MRAAGRGKARTAARAVMVCTRGEVLVGGDVGVGKLTYTQMTDLGTFAATMLMVAVLCWLQASAGLMSARRDKAGKAGSVAFVLGSTTTVVTGDR